MNPYPEAFIESDSDLPARFLLPFFRALKRTNALFSKINAIFFLNLWVRIQVQLKAKGPV